MVQALVLGGNGFIGSHLVDRLVKRGHQVRVFDRFSTPRPRYQSAGVEAVPGDMTRMVNFDELVAGIDWIFHLVSTTNPVTSARRPGADATENVRPAERLIRDASRAGVSHLFFSSTGGAIYGNQGKARYAETDNPAPVSDYGRGKLAIEHALSDARDTGRLASTVFRVSNPYGPGQPGREGHGLIPTALERALAHQAVPKFGDGTMRRDYVFIDDAIDMIDTIVHADRRRQACYNIGSGSGHSVNDVLETLAKEIGAFQIDTVPEPPGMVMSSVLSIDRYLGEYGPVRFTSLSDGIARTVAWRRAGADSGWSGKNR